MATNIPAARSLIERALSDVTHAGAREDLREALKLMTRTRKPARPTGHVRMTGELGARARRLYKTTDMSQEAIGIQLNVDSARVSEAINGMWY